MGLTLSAKSSFVLSLLAASVPALAQAGGPELTTDDPYYPGEGALSTPSRVLSRAFSTPRGTLGSTANRDKMIRLWLWRAEHYGHQLSPAVYNLPGVTPSPSADNPLMTDYDAMRGLFSYGWGVCGTNHAQMRVFADEAGWPSRRRDLNGDTGYEVFVDPNVPSGATGWRYFNTDQYTLHFLANDPSAHFASLDQVVGTNHHYIEWNPDVGLGYFMPQANTHGIYQDFAGVTGTVLDRSQQWRDYYSGVWQVTSDGNAPLYGEGYTSTPVVTLLKRGETFTRYFGPDGVVTALGLTGRLWWGFDGGNAGGGDNSPFLRWSFVQNAPARDQTYFPGNEGNPETSALVGQRYGNGCFLWQPDLTQGEHLDGTLAVTGSLTTGGSPALKSSGASTLVLFHHAPYTIAGLPSDGTNPANASSAGALLGADAVGSVGVEVSIDAGATWSSVGSLSGTGSKIDFTDSVKGRNQYLLRLSFADGQGLNALSLRTITMMNQGVYPNLKATTAQVSYSSSNAGALELSPNLWTAAAASSASGYAQQVARSANAGGNFYSDASSVGYLATDNNPLSLTYKITMPPNLAASGATWKQIFAAADCTTRVTPDGGQSTTIEVSPDQSTWTQIAQFNPPSDDQLSSYWTYGRSSDASMLGGTTYYVRYTTSNGSHPAAVRYLRLSATYAMPASQAPLQITYSWNNGSAQTSTHTVAAGAAADSWSISTGALVSQTSVAMAVPSAATSASAPAITVPPASLTVTAGSTATFSVTATGTAPLGYQWQKNGTPILGANGPSYTTPPTIVSDSGSVFKVTVTNAQGTVTSSGGTLTVNPGGGGGGGGTPTTVTFQEGANGYAGASDTYLDKYDTTGGVAAGSVVEGNKQWLEVRWYPSDGSQEDMLSLLLFDLSAIPATATVTTAQLTLYNIRAAANTASSVVTLNQITSAWTNQWTWDMGVPGSAATSIACPSTVGYSLAPTTPEAYVITGMASLVQGWVTHPSTNLGLMLQTATDLNIRFCSSRYPTAQYRPALEITYTTSGGGTPPTVTVGSPPASTATSPVTVSGTASATAPATVSQVTWMNTTTGASGTATGTASWSAQIPLASGANSITVTATDSSGNSSSTSFSVDLTGAGGSSAAPAGAGGGGSSHGAKCGATGLEVLLLIGLLACRRKVARRWP